MVTADGFKLELSAELASNLARQVAGAANALPKRGLEVCGLLLGQQAANTFVITSLVPLTCHYAEGPSFRTPESELVAELQQIQLHDVVGFYRSRNDGSLELDRQDEVLLKLVVRRPIAALVIRQQKNTPGEGRLLIWGGAAGPEALASAGKVFSTEQWLGVHRAAGPASSKRAGDPGKRGVFQPVTEPEPLPPPFPERRWDEIADAARKEVGPRTKWTVGAGSAIIVLVLIGWHVRDWSATTASEPVSAKNGEPYPPVIVEPNRDHFFVGGTAGPGGGLSEPEDRTREEAEALLSLRRWIRTDKNSTLREIAVRDLARRGKHDLETLVFLAETARSDASASVRAAAVESIALGWQVNTATRSFFEDRARSDESPLVREAAQKELANADRMNRVGAPRPVASAPSQTVAPSTVRQSGPNVEPSNAAPAGSPRAGSFPAPQPTAKAPTPAEVPRSPTVQKASNPTALPVKEATPAATAIRPAEVSAPVAAARSADGTKPFVASGPAEARTPTGASRVADGSKPFVGNGAADGSKPFVPAPVSSPTGLRIPDGGSRPSAPIRETPPALVSQPHVTVPADIRRLVRSETMIAVRADVDAKGRVSKIHPPEAKGGLNQMLWSIYSNAVRGWVFKPARRDEEAVAGEATLYFRLRPSEGR